MQRIYISVPEPMRDANAFALVERLQATAMQGGAVRVFGLPRVMRVEAVNLIAQL